jgi:peptidyl-prolyl cis-trans isomerase B (cyclophilin B)
LLFRSILLFLIFTAICCSSVYGAGYPRVLMHTNFGDITLELYNDKAPITVENFLQYVRTGFYDQMIFHRVIPDFMIQGGGYYIDSYLNPYNDWWTRPPIINESYNGLSNLRGTIAMARTDDPNSATSEFFINLKDNGSAATGFDYCVFGHVISDMNVIDAIADVNQGFFNRYLLNYPRPIPVFIYYAKLLTPGYWINADINNDGIVNVADIALIAANWKKTGTNLAGDLNQSNVVDMKDIAVYSQHWLERMSWYKPIAADINGDKIVNLNDLAILFDEWGAGGKDFPADLNKDWIVDGTDLFIFMQHWLEIID